MNKTNAIDFSADRLLAIASDCLENHDFISALKMLNKNAVLNGNDEDSFMLYAETFDDMGLYEKCVNGWFKYIDYAGENSDFAEAYEGLAISYMNMGQENFAAFYYNKLLMETDSELTPESRQEIIDAFLKNEKPPLRFAYPPRLADYSEEIEAGMECMRNNDFAAAELQFEKVMEGNEKYLAARNYIAMCKVITDRNEQAEEECRHILAHDPQNVQALTTLAAVKSQLKQTEESKELAFKLLEINPASSEDLYKIATVCCENGLHKQAYATFCKLDENFDYDLSLLFFKAVAAYNSGNAQKGLELFDTLLTIYPNAVAADFWHSFVLDQSKLPINERAPLDYFYRLPKDECEANIGMLSAFNSLSEGTCRKIGARGDIATAVHWCFDEGDPAPSNELKMLGAISALKGGMDDTVRDVLLDAFIADGLKMELLSALVQRNEEGEYGIVICNIYKRVTLVPIKLGRNKKKTFVRAYALAFSRFGILESDYGYMLAASAEKLYYKLKEEGKLNECRSVPSLAAAIVKYSEIKGSGLSDEQLCAFFNTTMEKIENLIGDRI